MAPTDPIQIAQLIVIHNNLAYLYAWRRVRRATGIAPDSRANAANQLAAHRLNREVRRYP
ncbi:MAG: hypothetical protein Q7U39_00505 [Nitrospira sp.]|nr:hypothetical protein [Nitrospira sp.]